MQVELILLILAAPATVVGAIFAFLDAETKSRKAVQAVIGSLILFGILGGLELFFQSEGLEQYKADLDQRWLIAQETPIDYVELEILLPDGAIDFRHLQQWIGLVSLNVDGAPFAGENSGSATILSISSLFGENGVRNASRLGELNAVVTRDEDTNRIMTMKEFGCLASNYYVRSLPADDKERLICSATVRVSLPPSITVADLTRARRISLSLSPRLDRQEGTTCFGKCSEFILSIRAVVNSDRSAMIPEIIELSPSSYLRTPNVVEQDGSLLFQVSGETLVDLAFRKYTSTLGYKSRLPFEATLGIFFGWFASATQSQGHGILEGTVWSTDAYPSEEELVSALGLDADSGALPFGAGEWCGFADESTCWHLFILMSAYEEGTTANPNP